MTALYVRLSREDGDKEESDSIGAQKELLRAFAENDAFITDFEFFVDDGFSGTDLERPAVKRLLRGVGDGSVKCVAVKDLSRLGRNYLDVGRLVDEVFPLNGVRFIAVNDGIDTLLKPAQSDTIIVPFKNLLNDEYSRDISQKIKSSLSIRRKRGDFLGSFASYGYIKDGNRLKIDENAAAVVRRVFSDFLSGMTKTGIAKKLNAEGIKSPSAYKRDNEKNYRPASSGLWSYSSVDRILKNPMYVGDTVQGRNGVISYKLHKTRLKPEEEWTTVRDTHEPIISRDTFAKAAELLKKEVRSDKKGSVHPLAGLVKCAGCGRALRRKRVRHSYGDYEYYSCPTYRMSKDACTKHSIRVDAVERAVLQSIRNEIDKSFDEKKVKPKRKPERNINRERERFMLLKKSAYEDYKDGLISKEEFLSFKKSYDEKLEAMKEPPVREDPFVNISKPEKLTRALALALIERIDVYEGGRIKIMYKFKRE